MKYESEHEAQKGVFEFCRELMKTYPALKMLYAIPNGFRSNPEAAKWMKDEGLKPGVPDLCLPVARGGFHGLYIEMKRKGGKKPTDDQCEWLHSLGREGYAAYCCMGREAAQDTILKYVRGDILR